MKKSETQSEAANKQKNKSKTEKEAKLTKQLNDLKEQNHYLRKINQVSMDADNEPPKRGPKSPQKIEKKRMKLTKDFKFKLGKKFGGLNKPQLYKVVSMLKQNQIS